MIVQAIRSTVFYILFLAHTAVLAIIVGLMAKLTPKATKAGWALVKYWRNSTVFLLRWIVGIKTQVTGAHNIPQGGCIIGSKHQSDWDIFAILLDAERPSFIAKKELLDIPLFGWAARWFDTISVDRKKGKDALPAMMDQARQTVAKGCRVIIFPEGTRRAPLAEPSYRSGITKMYAALDVPVVPVALTSGFYWGRNALVLWPGTARAEFLPPIMPGLAPDEFQRQLVEAIETRTNQMALEDVRNGLSRPITPRMRARIAALQGDLDEMP